MIRLFVVMFAILFMVHDTAHAYIDPGSAGIALQAVIGAVAAAVLFFGGRISRLLSLLRRSFRGQAEPPQPPETLD